VLVEAITNTNTSSTTANQLLDADGDTMIQVEESSDEDKIRFDTGGTERMVLDSSGLNITTADNSDNLTLTSTDADANSGPNLRLYRNSSSPADDDVVGVIDFEGRNNNSQDVIYANIQGEIMQEADGSEDGQLQFGVMKAGTLRNAFMIDRTEVAINEDSVDINFRVESNGNANMLFVDGGNNKVGIGTASPDSVLHLKDSGDTVLTLEGGASDANCRINFQNSGGTFKGMLSYDTDDNNLQFNVNDAERMRISSTGVVMIGTTTSKAGGDNPTDENSTVIGRGYLYLQRDDSASINQIVFGKDGQIAGRIVTTTATSLVSASDYRMKENVDYTWNATTRLKQLKPARYNWIADETNTLEDGFLAHEVSSVVPNAVFGEKDAVDSDGNPDMQGVDSSKLIPLLVKTIQELEARITTLEG